MLLLNNREWWCGFVCGAPGKGSPDIYVGSPKGKFIWVVNCRRHGGAYLLTQKNAFHGEKSMKGVF